MARIGATVSFLLASMVVGFVGCSSGGGGSTSPAAADDGDASSTEGNRANDGGDLADVVTKPGKDGSAPKADGSTTLPVVSATGIERVGSRSSFGGAVCAASSCIVAGVDGVYELTNGAADAVPLNALDEHWGWPVCVAPSGVLYAIDRGAVGERVGGTWQERTILPAEIVTSLWCGSGGALRAVIIPTLGLPGAVVDVPAKGSSAAPTDVAQGLPSDPGPGSLVFDGDENGALSIAGSVYRLAKGATSWTQMSGAPPLKRLSFDADGNLYGLATANAAPGYYRWSRAQNQWTLLDGGAIQSMSLSSATGVIVDGAGTLFVAAQYTNEKWLLERTKGGSTWSVVAKGLPNGDCGDMALSSDGRLIIPCTSGLFRTTLF